MKGSKDSTKKQGLGPDLNAAYSFLNRLHAGRKHVVVTAIPKGKGNKRGGDPITRTFNLGTGQGKTRFEEFFTIQSDQGAAIYFQLNPPTTALTNRQKRETTDQVIGFHVDIDPVKGADLADEQERILGMLTYNRPNGVPEPSLIIFSGGGYQAIWLLEDPIDIKGDIGLAEDAKLFNMKLEWSFGADNTHDVCRLLRLPGSVNTKSTNGREPALARTMKRDFDLRYPITAFTRATGAAAVSLDDAEDIELGAPTIPDPGDIQRLQREWNKGKPEGMTRDPDTLIRIILDGRLEDFPKEPDDSRSAWFFDVACNLHRIGLDTGAIWGTLTNPDWKISESIYHNRDGEVIRNPMGTAARQLKRAIATVKRDDKAQKEERLDAADRALEDMNRRHAVLRNDSGKCRVLTWDVSEVDEHRRIATTQTFADIRNAYDNEKVLIGKNGPNGTTFTAKPLGKWWTEHPKRKTYQGLRFRPDMDDKVLTIDGQSYLNLWDGFGVDAAPGSWSRMERHIMDGLAQGDKEHYSYIVRWLAWSVQNPAKPAEVALVFRGGKGIGKGFFGRTVRELFGQHGLQIASSKHLTGNFNNHLRDCVLLFADEAIAPGNKEAEAVLKNLITEDMLAIEQKGKDVVQVRNMIHLIMASNESWVVPATFDERRFAVFDATLPVPQPERDAYFTALRQQLDNGGREAMLHDLLAMDLEGWHPRKDIPQTAGLQDQKLQGLEPLDEWLLACLKEGDIPGARCQKGVGFGQVGILSRTSKSLRNADDGLFDHMRRVGGFHSMSENRMADFIRNPDKVGAFRDRDSNAERSSMWVFPPLAEVRAKFEARFGSMDWGDIEDWNQPEDYPF